MITLLASVFFAAAPVQDVESAFATGSKPVVSEGASAREIIETCRAMIPRDVEIRGHFRLRSRRGSTKSVHNYVLKRIDGKTELSITDENGRNVEYKKEGFLLGEKSGVTITWSDLALDYLWWDDVSFDIKKESETAQGILGRVVLLKNADRLIRVWVDKRTGAILQAHELSKKADNEGDYEVKRELFCTSLKKFGERWAPKNIEVGPPGAKYRTKIVVEDVREVNK